MSMSWENVCKLCGRDFDTPAPDPVQICWGCWSTKFTEAERQKMLPGATPIAFEHIPVKQRGLRRLREVKGKGFMAGVVSVLDMTEINDLLRR